MKINYSLKIKKRNQPQWLCWLLIVLPFAFGTLVELLRIPQFIKYTLDVAWVVALLLMVRLKLQDSRHKGNRLVGWAILFFLYTLFNYLFLYQSPIFYLWGARNNFRFYVAFAAFCTFLEPEDVNEYFDFFDKLFWINVVVSLVQYFVFDKNGDFLGGIFGVTQGCNGYSNVFFVIVLTKSVLFYLERREKFSDCFFKFAAVIIVSAMAEMKFFFVEAVIILVLATLFTNFSWRKVGVLLGGLAVVTAGATLLTILFPFFEEFFSLEWFIEKATADTGYTSSGDINRMNAISEVNRRFLELPVQRWFGLGLGNCDYSGFDFLVTPFYARHSWTHYTWLSTAFMYLETGWVGLIFFFGFFVLAFINARKIEKKTTGIARTYCRIAKIISVMCIVIAIYNVSLRTEAGYMAYFVLSVPSIVAKNTPSVKSVDASVG